MIVFCLSFHNLWGRTLDKHHQDACAVAYADDGYIKAKLSVALEVPSDIKRVFKNTQPPFFPRPAAQRAVVERSGGPRRRPSLQKWRQLPQSSLQKQLYRPPEYQT